MPIRWNIDDTVTTRSVIFPQQQVRQCEMTEMVCADLALEPVLGHLVRHRHDAGVVDEHVGLGRTLGEFPHRGKVLQVEFAHFDTARHARRGIVALGGVAHREHDMCTDARQFARGDQTESAVGAGDDYCASGEGG